MNVQDLNAMAIAQLKEFYSSLSNPISVIGTGKNGCKIKKDWIDAIEKSAIAPKEQEIIPDDEIPFYEPYTEEELEELEHSEEELEVWELEPEPTIFGTPISFGWTADRLLKGMKTVTRRTWKAKYAQMFINAYQQGKLIQAFDKDRRYGGKLIGYLKVSGIYQESVFDMPESDVSAEGYPELNWSRFADRFFYDLVKDWDENKAIVWVIRFEFIPLVTYSEILEKRGFQLFGDGERLFTNQHTEDKGEFNGWRILLTPDFKRTVSGNIFYQRVDLVNIASGECWSKDITKIPLSKECVLIARKAILDISYNMVNAKKSSLVEYENETKRPERIK